MEENKENEKELQELPQEEEKPEEGGKSYKGMTSTKNGLTIRALIGAFILYYAYSIASDITSTPADQRMPLYVFIVIFVIAGVWIVVDSVKRLIKKEYDH